MEAQKHQLQQKLEANLTDTRRLQQELRERALEAERLRQETAHLENRIEQDAAEKAALLRQLGSQSLSVDEETWQFQNDAGGWTSYSAKVSSELMTAFTNGAEVFTVICEGRHYEIDFKLKTQMNLSTSRRRAIRCDLGLPVHWQMTNEDGLKLLEGDPDDAQGSDISFALSMGTAMTAMSDGMRLAMQVSYKRYVTRVSDEAILLKLEHVLNLSLKRHDGSACDCFHGDSTFRLKEAYQVRNLYLWRRYQRFVKSIRDKQKQFRIRPQAIHPSLGDSLEDFAKLLQVNDAQNERLLFHGTKKFGDAQAIATEGFDNRVAQNGGLYGKGTYFAAQTCKSAQYALRRGKYEKASHKRLGTILLARVALGDPFYTEGPYRESRHSAA